MTYKNKSGISPVEFKVLIRPDSVEKITAGGVHLTPKKSEMDQWAQVKGTLVAFGGAAFRDPFTEDERAVLVPGARVYYDKYRGIMLEGADGQEYRLIVDKEIGAIIDNEMAVPISRGRSRAGLDAA